MVLRNIETETDFEVSWSPVGGATVGQLIAALDLSIDSDDVWIDGTPAPLSATLSDLGLKEGAVLELTEPHKRDEGLVLDVAGGPAAGRSVPIGRAPKSVGRSGSADLAIDDLLLAGRHFTVRRVGAAQLEIADLDSGTGTWVDGSPAAGVHSAGVMFTAGGSRFVAHDPRCSQAASPEPGPLETPEAPPEAAEPQPLPWLSIGAPVLLGVCLAWLFHPMMILIGVMSPVMVLAGWLERRRQGRRQQRDRRAAWEARLQQFALEVEVARDAATATARAAHPEPVAVIRGHLPPLNPTTADLAVATGRCERRWSPETVGPTRTRPDVVSIVESAGPLVGVPAVLPVRIGDRVSIEGPPARAEALCRWIIIQLAMKRPAQELPIRLVTRCPDSRWSWSARLPHLGQPAAEGIEIGCGVPDPTVTIHAGSSGTGDGIPVEVAAELARRVARRDAPVGAGSMEVGLTLSDLLGVEHPSAAWLLGLWSQEQDRELPTILGFGSAGVIRLDLAAVGPHALVAGTTGAGKSELLRTMVATTAALCSPERVNFVLIDYKGGSAFDACAGLPHVVGVVTDLDQALAERALRCLDSELRFREAHLRAAGVSEMAELTDGGIPRLCVIIDELATLAADLPGFTENLVGVAQRGRSLGVHLVLATQRPGGTVSPAVRTNTNLRICLRVPDPLDSEDVIGHPAAASIPRDQPGRAWIRSGPDELMAVQGVRSGSGLCDLVEAAGEAWQHLGRPEPRCPWPEPLPKQVGPADLPPAEQGVAIGLVDDPDNQRVDCLCWDPHLGHLVVVGGPRSGRTSALLTACGAVAGAGAQLVGIDAAGGDLAPMASLRRCVTLHDLTDLTEVEDLLGGLLVRAQGPADPDAPPLVIVVDNLGAVLAALESSAGFGFTSALGRLWSDGPARQICFAVSVDRPAAVPRELAAATATNVVLSLNDPLDYLATGLAVGSGPKIPGRGHETRTGRWVQVAVPRWE